MPFQRTIYIRMSKKFQWLGPWWVLVLLLITTSATLQAQQYRRIARVEVSVHVVDTERWCCGRNFWGNCNCHRHEAYNLHIRRGSFGGGDVNLAGTFYRNNWYRWNFYPNESWPVVRSRLDSVSFFNTSRSWVASAWHIQAWNDHGQQVINAYRTGWEGRGAWHETWPSWGMPNLSYDTPHESWLNAGALTMNWNSLSSQDRFVELRDPDGWSSVGVTASSSNTQLFPNGSINITQRSGSGDAGSRWIELRPAFNQFGTTQITVRTSEGGITRNHVFQVTVNRVGQAPTIALENSGMRVNDGGWFEFPNVVRVGDEFTPIQNLGVAVIGSSDATLIPVGNTQVIRRGADPSTGLRVRTGSRLGGAGAIGAAKTVNLTVRVTDGDGQVADRIVPVLVTPRERAGVRLADASGVSKGVSFERVGDQVRVDPAPWFHEGPITVEAWVYLRSYQNWSRVLDFANGAGNDNVLLAATVGTSGQPNFMIFRGGVQQSITSPRQLPLRRWTHLAATQRDGVGILYMDGVEVVRGVLHAPRNVQRTQNFLGRSNWGDGDRYLDGVLDEVRIWSKARGAEEIWDQAYPPLAAGADGLVGYWTFDSGLRFESNLSTAAARSLGGNGRAELILPVIMPGIPRSQTFALAEDRQFDFSRNVSGGIPGAPFLVINERPGEGVMETVGGVVATAGGPTSAGQTTAALRYTPLINFNSVQYPNVSMRAEVELGTPQGGVANISGDSVAFPAQDRPVRHRFRFRVDPVNDSPIVRNDGYIEFPANGLGYVFVPATQNPFGFPNRDAFTIEMWVRPVQGGREQWFASKYDVGRAGQYYFGMDSGQRLLLFREHAPWTRLIGNSQLLLNEWNHVAASYDGNRLQLFVNGRLDREAVDTIANNPTPNYTPSLTLGTGLAQGVYRSDVKFVGGMDEVRIWSTARTQDEISRSMGSVISGYEEGLLGYYRFDEGFGVWSLDLADEAAKGYLADARLNQHVIWRQGATTVNLVTVPEDAKDHVIRVSAVDVDRDPTRLAVNSQPTHGTVKLGSVNGQPVFLYTPQQDFAGQDSFRFTASDGVMSSVGTVQMRVVEINDPPVLSMMGNQVLEEQDSDYLIPFTVIDVDHDVSTFTFPASNGRGFSIESSDGVMLPVPNISVVGSGGRRQLKIAPEPGVYGSSQITLSVTDGEETTRQSFVVTLIPKVAYAAVELPVAAPGMMSSGLALDDQTRVAGFSRGSAAGAVERPMLAENLLATARLYDFGSASGRVTAVATGLNRTNTLDVGSIVTNGLVRPYRRHRLFVDERPPEPTAANPARSGFVGFRETSEILPLPATFREGNPLAVNAVGAMAGYLVAADNREHPFRLGLNQLSVIESHILADSSNARLFGRALSINRFGVVAGYRVLANGARRPFVHDGSSFTELPLPAGYVQGEATAINDSGVVVVNLTQSGGRRLVALRMGGAYVFPPAGATPSDWSFTGFAINNFQQVVGEMSRSGTTKAFLWVGEAMFDLTTVQPEGTAWEFTSARSINQQGQIVGLGRVRTAGGGTEERAFLANPASVIGRRLVRPEGAVARLPIVEILEAGPGDSMNNSFFWSEVEKSLYAIRPVKAVVRWHRNLSETSETLDVIPRLVTSIWPPRPEEHVAGAPVIAEPELDGSLYSFFALHYSTTPAASVDANTKVFNTNDRGTGYSVLRYLKTFGLPQDAITQTNYFHVVRTRTWDDSLVLSRQPWEIGVPIVDGGHSDYPGRNGYLFFPKTAVDSVGSDAAYDRTTRQGSLIAVNEVNKTEQVNDRDLVVVWYRLNQLGVAWAYKSVLYTPTWPLNAPKIIIASAMGSDVDGGDPITPVTYPSARIYNQPDPAQAGFNPNEEHALLLPGSIGEAAFALRNDLNAIKNHSRPFVLLKHRSAVSGLWAHRVYEVVSEMPPYGFVYQGVAGTEVAPPRPLSLLPLAPGNYISGGHHVALKDYRGRVLARQAGLTGGINDQLEMRYFYPLQPGFWYDLDSTPGNDLAVGTFVPWLDRLRGGVVGTPVPVRYEIRWPDTAPTLEVGESLLRAKKGLPGVADWASARIVFDSLNPDFSGTWRVGPGHLTTAPDATARLYDPLSERHIQLASSFTVPDSIRLYDGPGGRKMFRDLPYAIQRRLLWDPINKRLGYIGHYDDTTVGEPLLLPNIMSMAERQRIQALDGSGSVTEWDTAVEQLYHKTRNPNDLDLDRDGQPDQSFLVGYQRVVTRTNFVAGTPVSYDYDDDNITIESVPNGLKILSAAIGDNRPMIPQPGRVAGLGNSAALRVDWLPAERVEALTWEARVRRTVLGQNRVLLSRGVGASAMVVQVRSDNYVEFLVGGGRVVSRQPLSGNQNLNQWQHWAGTFNALTGVARLYLDGTVIGEATLPNRPVLVEGSLFIGGATTATRWVGEVDEVRIWHGVARDQSQLLAFMDQTLVSGQQGLVGYWNFDESVPGGFPDRSGYRNASVDRGAVRQVIRNLPTSVGGSLVMLKNLPDYRNRLFNESTLISSLESPVNDGDRYGQRIQALVVPPMTGDYTFWIAADDAAELLLGTDDQETSARRIAWLDTWSPAKSWETHSTQRSGRIRLEAGRAYYLEVVHVESGGGDHLSVRWQLPNGSWEGGDPNQSIPQERLLPFGKSSLAKTIGTVGNGEAPATAPWGIPPRYLTLIENDDPSLNGLPVGMQVIAIGAGPFGGDMKVLPPANVFDERLTLMVSPDFAGQPERFDFEWWYKPDGADFNRALLPQIDPQTGEVVQANGWILYGAGSGNGRNSVTIGEGGESGLLVMSDNWFLARYRGYNVGRERNVWSPWIGDPSSRSTIQPMLAEGWVKRVVRGLNPFDERVQNLAEASASARISMLEQAGRRYEGDIAFNPSADAINRVGLIEAYTTVLRKAQSLSTDGTPPVNYQPANNALLMMATRISDLYMLLANEAVADAADPTIGFSTRSEYGSQASSIFAFQNQLDSLLEEELVLLRGRDSSSAGVQGAPVYNRLFWNFTLGEGEVAYTQVYGIKDVNGDGRVDEVDSATKFPQGHGDAWGHYLTATKSYYGLLRNQNFTWVPRSENVLLAGVPIKVDFLDERKFALAAAYKAAAGTEIVGLTYRLNYVESPNGQWQGYSDTDPERAWGVDEWATRAGLGAYLDWAMANAILPSVDPDPTHRGIDRIDRTTVKELRDIATQFAKIQQMMGESDQGLNPLGLAQGVVPFDIDPTFIARTSGGSATHFEQIYERAMDAMNNAVTSFNHVNLMNVGIREISDEARDMDFDLRKQERDYTSRLIELFGYPYAGDIGPGRTYPSGYDGPDLLHYMYVNTREIGANNTPPGRTWQTIMSNMSRELSTFGDLRLRDADLLNSTDATAGTDILVVQYPYSAAGYAFEAPPSWGMRRAPGEIQLALSDLVQAEARLKQSLKEYDALLKDIDESMYSLDGEIDLTQQTIQLTRDNNKKQMDLQKAQLGLKITQTALNRGANMMEQLANATKEAIPTSFIAGLAAGGDVTAPVRGTIRAKGAILADVFNIASSAAQISIDSIDLARSSADQQLSVNILEDQSLFEHQQDLKQLAMMMRREAPLRLEVYKQKEVVQQTAGRLQKLSAEGLRVVEERTEWRKQFAGRATEKRYQDMAFRVFRNDAIRQYRSQLDLASRYVYLAATAYDYEANQLGEGANSGSAFLTEIVRQRTPGVVRDGIPVPGVPGLADPLARMSQNFKVLKTQMGFNNPQTETGRFSLRSELFRLKRDLTGNNLWKSHLKESIVADLWKVPEFRRFARPMAPESAGAQPAIVIKFPTTVTFGLNFFGWPLAGGDSAYDPSQFATKIRSAGVWFEGYNGNGLSMTPRVYLFPVGADVLRAPDGRDFETRLWRVVDQKLPLPFPIQTDQLRKESYIPMLDSVSGSFTEVRRFSALRAYHDSGSFSPSEASSDSRLIGRSVWNTEWMLIIPGGTLLNNSNQGLEQFISAVSDIRIFFQTYAYSGN